MGHMMNAAHSTPVTDQGHQMEGQYSRRAMGRPCRGEEHGPGHRWSPLEDGRMPVSPQASPLLAYPSVAPGKSGSGDSSS